MECTTDRYLWEIDDKSLIRMALEVILDVQQIEQSIVATCDKYGSIKRLVNEDIDVFSVKSPDAIPKNSFSYILSISQQVLNKIDKIYSKKTGYDGVVFIDPLYPLHKPVHIHEAIKLYSSQLEEARPWRSVISVDPLPNHFHPKKILKISKTGELDYFHQEGRRVYRRQQLEGEEYYRKNSAIFIFDPLINDSILLENNKIMGYVIDQPVIKIERMNDIDLVNVLSRII